ncbi:hypothetical protein HF521_017290 [Silurus meridionalis]|uniref:Uncharacterized protein n=1 Tax=Silurus meridionalis TaxID=175797 RepID=A0A8T0BPG2_SILME|nr:hypothetical protein HF521_017290 [Silurus meridionalis]
MIARTGMAQLTKRDLCARVLCYIFLYFLFLQKVEGSRCFTAPYPNYRTFLLNESVSPCNEYSWSVDKTVVANEIDFNHTMVLSRDSRGITFKTCHHNVAYKNVCDGRTIDCPACPKSQENRMSETSAQNSGHVDDVVGVTFFVIFFIFQFFYHLIIMR